MSYLMLIIIVVGVFLMAVTANSLMDILYFKFSSSIFSKIKKEKIKNWFDPKESWKNKYKDKDHLKGPAFFGSTNIFVWVTDAWHFCKAIMITCFEIAILVPLALYLGWCTFTAILGLILLKVLRGFIFEVTTKIFLKKNI